jgi:hypothetical protein
MRPFEKAMKNGAAAGEREDELGKVSVAVAALLGRWASMGPKGPGLGSDGDLSMSSTAAVAALSVPHCVDGQRGAPKVAAAVAAGFGGGGAPDPAPALQAVLKKVAMNTILCAFGIYVSCSLISKLPFSRLIGNNCL